MQPIDVTLLLVSRAPLAKLQAYKRRMGWSLPWVSAANTDFNFDFGLLHPTRSRRRQRSPGGPYPAAGAGVRSAHRGQSAADRAADATATGTDILD